MNSDDKRGLQNIEILWKICCLKLTPNKGESVILIAFYATFSQKFAKNRKFLQKIEKISKTPIFQIFGSFGVENCCLKFLERYSFP